MPLTDLQCLNAKPKNKKYKLADEQGLFLVVMTNGKRYWRYKYHIHGAERTISFGQYPITSLVDAREERFKAQKLISNGIDPLLARAEQKQLAKYKAGNKFEPIAREWHKFSLFNWQERHAVCIMYRLEKYVFPELGKFPITAITPAMVLCCLETVKLASPDIARRLLQYCKKIFEYANTTGRLSGDPTIGVANLLPKIKRGHFASIEIDDLPDFLQAVENVRFNVHRQTYLALRLILLVFVRHKELRKAKKAEFNLAKKIWVVPAERMKMRLEHLVPLSSQAVAIINELISLNPKSEYLLPSITQLNKTISENALLDFIYLAGYKEKMTVHGFRALAMGVCQERLKIPFIVIDRQLAHVPESEQRKAYDRAKFWGDRIVMMQRYSDYIDQIDPTHPTQRMKNDKQRFNSTTEQLAPTSNDYGYSTRVGYQLSGFTQTMESRSVPGTA
jgi:integrase